MLRYPLKTSTRRTCWRIVRTTGPCRSTCSRESRGEKMLGDGGYLGGKSRGKSLVSALNGGSARFFDVSGGLQCLQFVDFWEGRTGESPGLFTNLGFVGERSMESTVCKWSIFGEGRLGCHVQIHCFLYSDVPPEGKEKWIISDPKDGDIYLSIRWVSPTPNLCFINTSIFWSIATPHQPLKIADFR